MLKWILSVPFYLITMILGVLIEVYRELKKEGLLDDIKPLNAKDGLKGAKDAIKDISEEIKKG